ncbi:MAG TPA: hypothetical protein VLH79_15040 [Chthonomonadales bacterium]|nr:hypothetical protein [Chthonomonadales bacterium]
MAGLELAHKPDAALALERMEAWWEGALLDRACVQVTAPRRSDRRPPAASHASLRERWMDAEHAVDMADYHIGSTCYVGEILPSFFPNLGPEVLSTAYGAELHFGPETSWSEPLIQDWSHARELRFDAESPYVRTILEMTKTGLEKGRGRFVTGITDLHPGGDLAASLRDPQQLCLDLLESPEEVRALLQQVWPSFFSFYELQHALMRQAGQTVTTSWLPLFCEGRYYIPSNDFSCMVSPAMFREFFLEELIAETEWLDRSIYHLDGPGAIRHLDAILEVPRLGAVQWVYGSGNEPASKWIYLLDRVLSAGKNVHITVERAELDLFMESLPPERVMLQTWAPSPQEADDIVRRVARWTAKGRF